MLGIILVPLLGFGTGFLTDEAKVSSLTALKSGYRQVFRLIKQAGLNQFMHMQIKLFPYNPLVVIGYFNG